MITVLIFAMIGSILYAMKGGQFRIDEPNGRILSSILFGMAIGGYAVITGPVEWWLPAARGVLAGLGWLAGVSPSMGEEAGACGGWRGAWGPYITDKQWGRSYGIKKALQRGLWQGCSIALGLVMLPAWPIMALAGLTFPAAYWLGISFEQYRLKLTMVSWCYSEWLYGLILGGGIGFSIINSGA